MPQTLKLPNFTSNNIYGDNRTELAADIASGVSSLSVLNAANFVSRVLLVDTPGTDLAELVPNAATTSGTAIPLSTPTVLAHKQGALVTALFGDQIRIYRAPDGGAGLQPADTSFTLLTTVAINASSDSTEYTDSSGGGSYWYKYTFYNSLLPAETDIASAIAVRGTFRVNYCSLDEIRRAAGFQFADYVKDDQIEEKRQAAQDEIDGALDGFYQTPLQPPINDYLRGICRRLAAGLLRLDEYSQISNPATNGQDLYDAAQLDLDKLVTKQRVLVDKQGNSLDRPGGSGTVEGWPNSTTADTPGSSGGAPRVFRMSDVQGKQGTDAMGNPVGSLYYGRKW